MQKEIETYSTEIVTSLVQNQMIEAMLLHKIIDLANLNEHPSIQSQDNLYWVKHLSENNNMTATTQMWLLN